MPCWQPQTICCFFTLFGLTPPLSPLGAACSGETVQDTVGLENNNNNKKKIIKKINSPIGTARTEPAGRASPRGTRHPPELGSQRAIPALSSPLKWCFLSAGAFLSLKASLSIPRELRERQWSGSVREKTFWKQAKMSAEHPDLLVGRNGGISVFLP